MGDKWTQLRAGRAAVALLLGVFGLTAAADVRLSGMFNDDMVLQREMPIPVWGWAAPGESVLVQFSGQQETALADDFGCWQAVLQPEAANSVGQVLAAGSISITNVLVGEVWLCAGDETMDSRLQKSLNALAEGAAANYPEIRLAQVELANTPLPAKDVTADWQPCSPATAPTFSANGYFFARKLHQELGVPVGMIMATYGVSPIVSWLPSEGFRDTPALQWAVDDIYNSRPSTAEGKARWETYLSDMVAWRPKALAAVAAGEIPVDRPLIPNDLWITANIPTKLFNGEIHPLIPQAMRGVIWAQGVTDRLKPTGYQASQLALIDSWRTLWGQGDFPFYFAQLPRYNDTHPDYITGTPVIREVQRQCLEMTNTGMAVTMDVVAGYQTTDVNSQAVGTRLALWALAGEYGQTNLVYSGPLFSGFEVSGSEATLQFTHVGSGLMAGYKDGLADTVEVSDPLDTFEMARADGQWFPASAVVAPGGETLTVSSADVASPVGVRYGYSMDPDGSNLYNREGLPASPFTMINYGLVPEGTLINHVFDGGTEALDGSLVDGGSLQTGSLMWNSHASITADGVISLNNATAADEASAFIDLGGVISQGSSNDIYIFEIVMDNATTEPQPFLSFGLSGSGNIDLSHNNSGSPWASWTASDFIKASTGKPSSGDLHDAGITPAGGSETFTFVLDLRDAALMHNTVALYRGSTQLGSTAFFSGDEGFQYVGIGAKTSGAGQTAAGTIESVKLVKNGSVLSTDYALTVSSPHGAASPGIGTTLVASGTVVNAHVTSPVINGSTQYVATGWAGTGSVGSGSGTSVSFTMTNDTALTWLWQTNVYYDIVATAGVGGSISPAGTTTLLSGGTQLYTISLDADFALTDVAVDGGSIGAVTEYTFTNVTANHTITAMFASTTPKTLLIDHTFSGGAGTLNGVPVSGGTLQSGSLAWVTDTDTEFNADGIIDQADNQAAYIALGAAITTGNSNDIYELEMVVDQTTLGTNPHRQLCVGFWPGAPDLQSNHDWTQGTAYWTWKSGGEFYGNTGRGYTSSDIIYTTRGIESGYETFTTVLDLTKSVLTDCTVSIYDGDPQTGALMGSANLSGDELFQYVGFSTRNGALGNVEATIQSFKLSRVDVGGTSVTNYMLTVTSPQGTPSPNGVTAVASGTVVNATANSPVSNGSTQYVATGWVGTGSVGNGSGTSVSFTITNDTALAWFWETNSVTHEITASAGSGGVISPIGSVSVSPGNDQLFTITPSANHAISDVTVDGGSIGPATEYTFTNVTATHTIDAAFVSTVSGIVLIAHTFDEGAGNLNATTLEINNIGAGTWNAGLVTEDNTVDANGNVSGGNGASAWVHLNGAITMGSPDDTYEVAMIADKLGGNYEFQGGFWGPSDPQKTGQHKWQGGTAYWYWQTGSVTAYAGAGHVDPISGSTALANDAGPTLFTLRLDLTDATLANNSFGLYIGDSATGTLVGSAHFSGDESFEELGISGRPTGGQTAGRVTSLTLTREPLAPATAKGTLIMIR